MLGMQVSRSGLNEHISRVRFGRSAFSSIAKVGCAIARFSIDSKLRGCDLVKIKIGTLVIGPEIRTRAMVVQQKTDRPVQFDLMVDARASLLAWLERRSGTVDDFAFPSRINRSGPMSTRQYARLVGEWVSAIGLRREEYGTHSLRRTKASIIYKATGNLRAVQILLGHTKIENTVRYLGVDVEARSPSLRELRCDRGGLSGVPRGHHWWEADLHRSIRELSIQR